MTGKAENVARRWSPWRIAGWSFAGGLLLLPLVAMQFTDEVKWDASDFVFMGVLIGSVGLGFELAARQSHDWAYRAGAGTALVAAFLLVWVNAAVGIIGDEGNPLNLLYAGVLAIGLAGAAIAALKAPGMARAMTGMAIAQALVAIVALIAAPDTQPGPIPILILNSVFVGLFLLSAALFRKAARSFAGPSA